MKTHFTISCRGSKLSLAQVEIFKLKAIEFFPNLTFENIIKSTRGDQNRNIALETLEGKDFFTDEIQQELFVSKADFAVHSMKDISGLDFFEKSTYAVIDRGQIHDVAIFNANIIEKLKNGHEIIIGTSSPRRALIGLEFLKKVLPKYSSKPILLKSELIRGNVDTRLEKLNKKDKYDGVILALTGINRLLADPHSKDKVHSLVKNKKKILLSLFQSSPAANQGALVVETLEENADALKILKKIRNSKVEKQVQKERRIVQKFGHEGCSQLFGVFSIRKKGLDFSYASGIDKNDNRFVHWEFDLPKNVSPDQVLYFKDLHRKAFTYRMLDVKDISSWSERIFVTNSKCVSTLQIKEALQNKTVWASGITTMIHLASKGIWVEGCVDGLGIGFLNQIWDQGIFNYLFDETMVLTNLQSKLFYPNHIKNAVAVYSVSPTFNEDVIKEISQAKTIFWSSFQQFRHYKTYLKKDVKHLCASGRTADLLKEEGVNPILFPTINAFKKWKNIT